MMYYRCFPNRIFLNLPKQCFPHFSALGGVVLFICCVSIPFMCECLESYLTKTGRHRHSRMTVLPALPASASIITCTWLPILQHASALFILLTYRQGDWWLSCCNYATTDHNRRLTSLFECEQETRNKMNEKHHTFDFLHLVMDFYTHFKSYSGPTGERHQGT
jgi:hypothetical protein